MTMRSVTLIPVLPIIIFALPTVAAAQGSAVLAGAWQRISLRDSAGVAFQPPSPASVTVYSANGYFAQVGFPSGRPKVEKDWPGMSRDELVAIVRNADAWRGTYSVSGNTLTRHSAADLHPTGEGVDIVQVFRIAGDTLILTSPGIEARFVRLR